MLAARLYDTSGNLLHTLTSSAPIADGNFGRSVALVGTFAAIRAFDASGAYPVHVFDASTGAFVQTLSLATTPSSWMLNMGTTLLVGGNVQPPFVLHRVDLPNGTPLATIAEPDIGPT